MKATNSSPAAPSVLRLVGVILILLSVIDSLTTIIPPNFSDKAWFAGVTAQIVDRGIIPLVGLGFLFTGAFLETGSFALPERVKPFATIRFWAMLLATLLGIVYLVAFPLHLNNTRQLSDQALSRIAKEAGDAENQLATQVQQQRDQFKAITSDPNQVKQLEEQLKQIEAAINSNQLSAEQKAQAEQQRKQLQAVQQLRSNPNAVEERAKEINNQGLTAIRDRRQQLEREARSQFWQRGVRVGIASLLLSFAYFIIGISGLRELGILKGKRRAALR